MFAKLPSTVRPRSRLAATVALIDMSRMTPASTGSLSLRMRLGGASGHAQRDESVSLSRDRLFRNRLEIGHVDSEMSGHALAKWPVTIYRNNRSRRAEIRTQLCIRYLWAQWTHLPYARIACYYCCCCSRHCCFSACLTHWPTLLPRATRALSRKAPG